MCQVSAWSNYSKSFNQRKEQRRRSTQLWSISGCWSLSWLWMSWANGRVVKTGWTRKLVIVLPEPCLHQTVEDRSPDRLGVSLPSRCVFLDKLFIPEGAVERPLAKLCLPTYRASRYPSPPDRTLSAPPTVKQQMVVTSQIVFNKEPNKIVV